MAGVVKMRGAFGGHFAWQVRNLVNSEDVLKGSKVVFCEAVVIFGFEHDDGFVWQVQHFGCLGSFLVAGAVLCRPRQKMAET